MNRYQSIFAASLILIFFVSAASAYIGSSKIYEKEIEKIKLEKEIKAKNLTVEKSAPGNISTSENIELSPESCLKCHEKEHLYTFHYPEKIIKIAEKKNISPRLCNTCHGSRLAMVVHFEAIKEKRIACKVCHVINNSGFVVVKKPNDKILICEVCHANGNYIKIHIDGNILENAPIDDKWIRKKSGKTCLICHNKNVYGIMVRKLHEKHAKEAGKV